MERSQFYIVELIVVGNAVKATAFDPVSLREVAIVGATGTPRKVLENLAVSKLQFVLKSDSSPEFRTPSPDSAPELSPC